MKMNMIARRTFAGFEFCLVTVCLDEHRAATADSRQHAQNEHDHQLLSPRTQVHRNSVLIITDYIYP